MREFNAEDLRVAARVVRGATRDELLAWVTQWDGCPAQVIAARAGGDVHVQANVLSAYDFLNAKAWECDDSPRAYPSFFLSEERTSQLARKWEKAADAMEQGS